VRAGRPSFDRAVAALSNNASKGAYQIVMELALHTLTFSVVVLLLPSLRNHRPGDIKQVTTSPAGQYRGSDHDGASLLCNAMI